MRQPRIRLTDARQSFLIPLCAAAHKRPPKQITLDIDATDDPLHRNREGSFFNANYDSYCYPPLYIFCGRHLLVAKLPSCGHRRGGGNGGARRAFARTCLTVIGGAKDVLGEWLSRHP